jgi:hypothetical protein
LIISGPQRPVRERRDAATASTQLIRWCLSDPARAAAFREFLVAVSLGGACDANALATALGMDVPGLETAFRNHLRGRWPAGLPSPRGSTE